MISSGFLPEGYGKKKKKSSVDQETCTRIFTEVLVGIGTTRTTQISINRIGTFIVV